MSLRDAAGVLLQRVPSASDEVRRRWHRRLVWRLPVDGHTPKSGYRYTDVPPKASSQNGGQRPTIHILPQGPAPPGREGWGLRSPRRTRA